MIGNANPPAFTYLIGEAMKGTLKRDLRLLSGIDVNALLTDYTDKMTRPDNSGKTYPLTRRFQFSIPELRFKSGTWFELSNANGLDAWQIAFYFGDSKRIRSHNFQRESVSVASRCTSNRLSGRIESA